MTEFVPWNSQPLDEWSQKYAEGKFITLDGQSTHYIEMGAGEPVILIHGFFYDTFAWHNNIHALAQHFKVFALDLWGFGYSTRAPLDYGYPVFAAQLLRFLDALNIPKAALVGHSMGGGTSIFFTDQNRDRVTKLVLVDATGIPNPLPLMGKLTNLPLVGELMYGLNSNFIRTTALKTNWIHNHSHITDSYFENVTRFHKIEGSTKVMLTILRKQSFHTLPDQVRRLGTTDVPILIVWGRHDKAIPVERGYEMHSLLDGSQLQIFEDTGHCPHDEMPEQFNRLVIDFLS